MSVRALAALCVAVFCVQLFAQDTPEADAEKTSPKLNFRDAFQNHPELFSNSDHLNFKGARKLTFMLKKRLDRLQDIAK